MIRRQPPFPRLVAMLCLAILPMTVLSQEAAPRDRIELEDGSVIVGTIKDTANGKIVVKTAFAGKITIEQATVVSLRTRTPQTVQLDDGTLVESQPLRVENRELVVSEPAGVRRVALDRLVRVNPEPWELGRGYDSRGNVTVAFATQRGNSDTDEFDYRAETLWVGLGDRYTLSIAGEVDRANGNENANNTRLAGKYDRFVGERFYWGYSSIFERDKFADLDLRITTGPYAGRKWFTAPVFTLESELGLSYVSESYIDAKENDTEYAGATWDLSAESNWLGPDTRLYLRHNGVWNLTEGDDVILNTTFGVAVPLLGAIEGAAEVQLRYDAGAIDGVEPLDESYRFRVGYRW